MLLIVMILLKKINKGVATDMVTCNHRRSLKIERKNVDFACCCCPDSIAFALFPCSATTYFSLYIYLRLIVVFGHTQCLSLCSINPDFLSSSRNLYIKICKNFLVSKLCP